MARGLIKGAVCTSRATTRRGALERVFAMLFDGFVYSQMWEDPEVDLAALELQSHHTVVAIASAGCNVLSYLVAGPGRILAVDINPHHLALSRLKLTSLAHLPSHDAFFSFWGAAASDANVEAYERFLKPVLDPDTTRYWERRSLLGRRRIDMFARNLYRHGLLGRCIGLAHWLVRVQGKRLEQLVEARTPAEQREAFERIIAPAIDSRLARALTRTPVPFFALGVPPAQYDELLAACDGDLAALLRSRIQRLACAFPATSNYFAWQAFTRGYDVRQRRAVPPYLRRDVYDVIRARTRRVEIHEASIVSFLRRQPARSINRFVLLDAQDWMAPAVLAALWEEIDRTADPDDTRVIFRTAGEASLLPRKLGAHALDSWQYRQEESRAFHESDRSSIFGGFHLYSRRPQGLAS
jgi:S-adenosylmethionine-diacylglycerol 3-amino-3-carboxypropyl transferase